MALKSALPGIDILQGGKKNLKKSFAFLNELVMSTKIPMDFVDFFLTCDLTVPFNNVMYSLTYSGILSPISLSLPHTHTHVSLSVVVGVRLYQSPLLIC